MGTSSLGKITGITVAATLLLYCAAAAAGTPGSSGRQTSTSTSPPVIGWGRPHVVGCLYVLQSPAGVPDRVVVKQNPAAPRTPLSEVHFVAGWPDSPRTVLVHPEGLTFVDMFLGPDGILIIEWGAGDRPVTQAFELVPGGAKLVFNEGARGGFEYWDGMILRTSAAMGADGNYHATTTEIWGWNGKQYSLVATVPYDQRLEALAKLEHEAKAK